ARRCPVLNPRHCCFFHAEDGIRGKLVTGVQTCALPIWHRRKPARWEMPLFAPPAYVPRSMAFPTSPVSADAALLMTAHVVPAFRSEERRVGREGGGPQTPAQRDHPHQACSA